MTAKTSEELREEWREAWATIAEIVAIHWMRLSRDCVILAIDCISDILPKLTEKAWISGKQGHGK